MNKEIQAVEIKLAYLENQVCELNETIIEQQKIMDKLSFVVYKLQNKVDDLIEEAGDGERVNRKPPHY